MFYTYILKLSNNEYYAGFSSDLKTRIFEHQRGGVDATKNFLPIEIVCYLAFKTKQKALDFEKYLKTGSGFSFRNKRLI